MPGFCAEGDPGKRQPDRRRATPGWQRQSGRQRTVIRDHADKGEPDVPCEAAQIEPGDTDGDRETYSAFVQDFMPTLAALATVLGARPR